MSPRGQSTGLRRQRAARGTTAADLSSKLWSVEAREAEAFLGYGLPGLQPAVDKYAGTHEVQKNTSKVLDMYRAYLT